MQVLINFPTTVGEFLNSLLLHFENIFSGGSFLSYENWRLHDPETENITTLL